MKFEELFRPHLGSKEAQMQKTIDRLNEEIKRLKSEVEEQAVLNGKGSEREARYLAACSEYRAKLDKLETENADLRADKARLDWLDKTGCWLTITGQKNFVAGSSRAVIDAAMKEGK